MRSVGILPKGLVSRPHLNSLRRRNAPDFYFTMTYEIKCEDNKAALRKKKEEEARKKIDMLLKL